MPVASLVRLRFSPKNLPDISPFTLDFGQWLETIPNDTLTSLSVTCSPSDLNVAASSISGNLATAWLGGGTLGTDYTVSYAVTTSGGRSETRSALVYLGPR